MIHIRRTAIVLAGLVAGLIGGLATAPAAFAMRVAVPPGGGPSPSAQVAMRHGTTVWQPVLFTVAALTIVAVAVAVVRSHRRTARPPALAR